MKIGILSDTHSYIDDRIIHHLDGCDMLIHAGDIGDVSVLDELERTSIVYAVYGNIDGTPIRARCKEFELITVEGLKILLIHIAGALGRYNENTRGLIKKHRPDVLICGHSHILKVSRDKRFNLMHINPGAAGRNGFHKVRTLLTMDAVDGELADLKAIELGPRSAKSID